MAALVRALLILIPLGTLAQGLPSPESGGPVPHPLDQPALSTPGAENSGSVSPDSTHLVLVKKVPVVYPPSGERRKLQGPVVVQVSIAENGDVETVQKISGDDTLASAAADAIKEWKFRPYVRNGNPVEVSTRFSFRFVFCDKVVDSGSGVANANGDSAADSPGTMTIIRLPTSAGKKLTTHKILPAYPDRAKLARVQGDVVLRVEVAGDGSVQSLYVTSSTSPLLSQAAIDAVRQWRYKPYLLRNVPTAFETSVNVNFSLYGEPYVLP